MALMHSTMVPLGDSAHEFSLPGVDGKEYTLDCFEDRRILVIIFMCNHCPYVKAVLSRLVDLQNQMGDKGVQLVGINSNDASCYPDDSFDNMKKIVQEMKIPFPYLFDATQKIARAYDAVCTPDIYVYGEERTLIYRGRIDDNWEHPEKVTKRDLKEAVEAALAGDKISEEQIPSMGCSIKWKQN
jgi:peroxiredoxin